MTLVYHVNKNILVWGDETYRAVSGPYGKGTLPPGFYDVKRRHVVSSSTLSEPFRHSESGRAFFIPIWPRFDTERSGFGIHPDGGVHGTRGCIGLQGSESPRFWSRWDNTAMDERPTSLEVEDRTIELFPMPILPLSE